MGVATLRPLTSSHFLGAKTRPRLSILADSECQLKSKFCDRPIAESCAVRIFGQQKSTPKSLRSPSRSSSTSGRATRPTSTVDRPSTIARSSVRSVLPQPGRGRGSETGLWLRSNCHCQGVLGSRSTCVGYCVATLSVVM